MKSQQDAIRAVRGASNGATSGVCLLIFPANGCKTSSPNSASVMEEREPNISWRGIRGLGNVLRHEYDVVDDSAILQIVERELGPLREACVANDRLDRRQLSRNS